jgi:hypothetical protein
MITATISKKGYGGEHFLGREMRVHGLVNRGGWFGNTWLVVIPISNAIHAAIVVEGEHEQSIIDELADSPTWSHLIDCDECWECGSEEHYCDCDHQQYAGNDSHRVNTDNVTILAPCKVKYFEPDNREWH